MKPEDKKTFEQFSEFVDDLFKEINETKRKFYTKIMNKTDIYFGKIDLAVCAMQIAFGIEMHCGGDMEKFVEVKKEFMQTLDSSIKNPSKKMH